MVQWKGELEAEQAGKKAARLDALDGFNVPNFYVITRSEVERFLKDIESADMISDADLPSDILDEIKSAYKDIGMSSEVRGASDRARSLVGGTRDSQLVSVRISGDERGVNQYRLNVGAAKLEQSVKDILADYYRDSDHDRPVAVIIQQMVEPEFSGASISNYIGDYALIETVEGLGISLEEGITRPDFYLVRNGEVVENSSPDEQIKITRNPINGNHRRKTVTRNSEPFKEQEVEDLVSKIKREDLNVKFAYKRGTFYITDVFPTDGQSSYQQTETSLDGIRVSTGEMNGRIGQDLTVSDDTLKPERYREGLIARNGGYTSRDAQLARRAGKPAVFSYSGELEQGSSITLSEYGVEPGQGASNGKSFSGTNSRERQNYTSTGGIAASTVLPIDSGRPGIYLSPPFGPGYRVTEYTEDEDDIPREGYLDNYRDVLTFNGDKALVDGRRLDREGLMSAIEHVDAELKILLLDTPDSELIQTALGAGFEIFGTSRNQVNTMEQAVEREERRFILRRLRELD